MFEIIIKWVSGIGGLIAIILAIFKIVEYFHNKPILTFSYHGYGFEYTNEKNTIMSAGVDITNVGNKSTTIKRILYDVLDAKKKKLNINSRLSLIWKKLSPGDFISEVFDWEIKKELPKAKYYFKLIIETTYGNIEHMIPLSYLDWDAYADQYFEDKEKEKASGFE